MMSPMDIPEEIRAKLMEQLGVSSDHIDEALGVAQKSPNVGVTPFLQRMRKMSEYFKTFKNQEQKLQQFSSLSNISDKLQLVNEALSSNHEFRDVENMFRGVMRKPHNPEKSKKLRDVGNKLYQHKKFTEAIKAYTDAMLEVTIDETGKCKEIGLALGNRSAVFFQNNQFQNCLDDIEASIMFGYPEDLQYKLMDRKGRCLISLGRKFEAQETLEMASLLVQKSKHGSEEKIKFKQEIKHTMSSINDTCEVKNDDDEDDTLELSDHHPCIPGLSSKVEVRYDEVLGRHSVSTTDIAPGEIIAEDRPVTWCLSYNYSTSHCHHCCSPLITSQCPGMD